MKLDDVKTFEDLERYLRGFANFGGDPVPYDFVAAFRLFLAILDNLANHSLDADFEDLEESVEEAGPVLPEKQLAIFKRIESLA